MNIQNRAVLLEPLGDATLLQEYVDRLDYLKGLRGTPLGNANPVELEKAISKTEMKVSLQTAELRGKKDAIMGSGNSSKIRKIRNQPLYEVKLYVKTLKEARDTVAMHSMTGGMERPPLNRRIPINPGDTESEEESNPGEADPVVDPLRAIIAGFRTYENAELNRNAYRDALNDIGQRFPGNIIPLRIQNLIRNHFYRTGGKSVTIKKVRKQRMTGGILSLKQAYQRNVAMGATPAQALNSYLNSLRDMHGTFENALRQLQQDFPGPVPYQIAQTLAEYYPQEANV